MGLDDMAMLARTFVWALIALGMCALLLRYIPPPRFRQFKWTLAGGAAIFWGILGSALLWGFWDSYYRYFFSDWQRWIAPVAGIEYAVVALGLKWLAQRLPGNPALNFCLLGGLESVPEHLYGVYVLRIMDTVPMLQGISVPFILFFAFFEYILYWSLVLVIAELLRRAWDWHMSRRTRLA